MPQRDISRYKCPVSRTKERRSTDDDEKDTGPNLRLRGHARYAGLSDEEIAEELGWHVKKVQRLLNGGTRLTVNHLHIFSRVLRKPAHDLLDVDAPAASTKRAA